MTPSSPAVRRLAAPRAFVGGAMEEDVVVGIDAGGTIVSVAAGVPAGDAEPAGGILVPGVPDVHSHAFQRAMAGLAERAGPEGDDFWAWREIMYRFLGRLSPDDVEAVAAQLAMELLESGYTTLGEFHYLHNDPDGRPYADPAELAHRIVAGAKAAGIGLALLPVLYQTSRFGGAPATEGQRRFVMGMDAFARLVQDLAARYGADADMSLGVAPHSLRAVTPDALRDAVAVADALGPDARIHIHAAEQTREVEDCLAWSGKRPVRWLLDEQGLSARWCVIHATHLDEGERRDLAHSGAVAGLCPSTEANLGDGIFPLVRYLADGGRFGIGSDSNVTTSPVEELRWLEYVRRLETRRRNVTETRVGASVGAALLSRALAGGAQAVGRPVGAIAPGLRADLVVLDAEHPLLAGRAGDRVLDAWIFAGNVPPVRHVMVGGRWVVRDGRHPERGRIAAAYRRTVARLLA